MSEAVSSGRTSNSTRWLQLIVGIICMSMIANLQYGWTLFVAPIDAKFGWGRPAIQVAFAIFVLTETWLVPIEGWFVDRFGPRIVVVIGGVLCGISWALNSVVDSLFLLYVSAAIGGIGAGAVYGTCVGNALKWFPDRRGLAAGLTAAGFGAGSALTIIPISNMIKASGYQATFLAFGIGQGLVVFALAWILRAPQRGEVAAPAQIRTHLRQSDRDYEWTQVLRSPIFWVMYVMFVLVGISWMLNAYVSSLAMLYISAAIGGIGAGAVYGTCVGNALKWFPDKRGLAAGLTAAGFGAGSALTIIPIQAMIRSSGYEATFFWFGLGQGLVVFVLGWLLLAPRPGQVPASTLVQQSARSYTPGEMLRTPIFWVMYLMFVLVGAGGLMATAQLAPIANDFKVAGVPVTLIGITLPALTFALSIDRVLNGITRPFFGWVSDHIGRENTMFIAFSLEAVGIWALSALGHDPVMFVLLSGLVFFAWGEIYSLFPSTCTDVYGAKYATTNAGLLYTAKGTASLLVPLGNVLMVATGNWHAVFIVAAVMNGVAAVMALAVLRPLRAAERRTRTASRLNSPALDVRGLKDRPRLRKK